MYGVCRVANLPRYMQTNEDRPITFVELNAFSVKMKCFPDTV